jgi:hypothetical protein
MANTNQGNRNRNPIRLLLLTGLLVGSLDILTAITDVYIATGSGPAAVLKYIASGVFGNEAFDGGAVMIAWGLFFHFAIAFSFTIFFFWIYPRIKIMQHYPVLTGVIYGIFIWIITARIIVPLSNTPPPGPFKLLRALKAITILIIMIGLPLSFIMRRYFKYKAVADKDPSDSFYTN